MAQQAMRPPVLPKPPATQKEKPVPLPRIRPPPAIQKEKPLPPPRTSSLPIPPATQKEKPIPPLRTSSLPIPPATQKEEPLPSIGTSSLAVPQRRFHKASKKLNSLQRLRQAQQPPPRSEDIKEAPTKPLQPIFAPLQRSHDERSNRGFSFFLPPPPADWLDLPPGESGERPPSPPPDLDTTLTNENRTFSAPPSHLDKTLRNEKKTFSRRKERKKLGLVGNLTIDVPVAPDPYFKTESVLSLNVFNFDEFIKKYEKAIIMFFHSRKKESFYPSREFANASMRSSNKNHVFASVDCAADNELCCRENAKQLPTLKLYSNGFPVSSLSLLENFNADQMNMLITMTPVLKQPRGQPIIK